MLASPLLSPPPPFHPPRFMGLAHRVFRALSSCVTRSVPSVACARVSLMCQRADTPAAVASPCAPCRPRQVRIQARQQDPVQQTSGKGGCGWEGRERRGEGRGRGLMKENARPRSPSTRSSVCPEVVSRKPWPVTPSHLLAHPFLSQVDNSWGKTYKGWPTSIELHMGYRRDELRRDRLDRGRQVMSSSVRPGTRAPTRGGMSLSSPLSTLNQPDREDLRTSSPVREEVEGKACRTGSAGEGEGGCRAAHSCGLCANRNPDAASNQKTQTQNGRSLGSPTSSPNFRDLQPRSPVRISVP